MAPRVSVIIPTFNRRAMLEEAIRSVESQTFADRELIVVDDGSDDGTWDGLRQRGGIRALRNPSRRGPSAARNRGAASSGGELLAFLDSDDLFLPEKLARQVALLEADPRLALCHTGEVWLRGGKELRQRGKHEKRGGWIFEHCLPMCRVSPSATVIRRAVFDELGGFDEELEVAEDYELWLRVTSGYPVGFIEQPLVIKRGGHPDQLSMKYGWIEVFRVEALRRLLVYTPLTPDQRRLVLDTLESKCEIVARGCAKRGRLEQAARYRVLPLELAITSRCDA